jgi:hypothetical protein
VSPVGKAIVQHQRRYRRLERGLIVERINAGIRRGRA